MGEPTKESSRVQMSNGWVARDDTFKHWPLHKRLEKNTPELTPERYDLYSRALDGLSNLQLSSHNPVNLCAMDVVIETLYKSLPKKVRHKTYCAPANGPDLWSEDETKVEATLRPLEEIAQGKIEAPADFSTFLEGISRFQYVIWPLWVEDSFGSHWVVLFWNSAIVKRGDGVFPHIEEVRLFDPALDYGYFASAGKEKAERRARITSAFARMLRIFCRVWAVPGLACLRWNRGHKGATAPNGLLRGFHANFDLDEGDDATGERCYSVVKQLLAGVLEQEISQPVDHYEPHRQHLGKLAHVDPYLARVEMAGICAWKCIEALDFRARIAIEYLPSDAKVPALINNERRWLGLQELKAPDREYKITTWEEVHQAKQKRLAEEQEKARGVGGFAAQGGDDSLRHKNSAAALNRAASPSILRRLGVSQSTPPKMTGITRKRSSSSPAEGETSTKRTRV